MGKNWLACLIQIILSSIRFKMKFLMLQCILLYCNEQRTQFSLSDRHFGRFCPLKYEVRSSMRYSLFVVFLNVHFYEVVTMLLKSWFMVVPWTAAAARTVRPEGARALMGSLAIGDRVAPISYSPSRSPQDFTQVRSVPTVGVWRARRTRRSERRPSTERRPHQFINRIKEITRLRTRFSSCRWRVRHKWESKARMPPLGSLSSISCSFNALDSCCLLKKKYANTATHMP